ncbi:hypothetical protein [Chromatocurvus halotolerans]|uniref:Superfamily III holin-X n=1 Tax=Chromatocurvus halotolerans TaxID=1132028 RepID=A0A4R2L1F5_9GAMM|nr:hypothetical protein [Chromatocurvus halotolerans]TCO77566.1 hypothetical protein EV688_10223 [Chromatocurvus halotolerans]
MPEDADPHDSGAQNDRAAAELQAWFALGSQAVAVMEQLATVLRLELGLAVADAKRLLMVVLAMIPLILLAWLGFCALLAWLAVVASESVTLGLTTFLLLQLGSLFLLARAARRFQSSLGFPASRRQWRALMHSQAANSGETGQGK